MKIGYKPSFLPATFFRTKRHSLRYKKPFFTKRNLHIQSAFDWLGISRNISKIITKTKKLKIARKKNIIVITAHAHVIVIAKKKHFARKMSLV